MRAFCSVVLCSSFSLAAWFNAVAADPPAASVAKTDLSEYLPPEKAATVAIRTVAPDRAGLAGYLGVRVTSQAGKVLVAEVQRSSPAEKAGLKPGDVLVKLDGRTVPKGDALREWLLAHAPDETVSISVDRAGTALELRATLAAVSRPMKFGLERVAFGAQVVDAKDGEDGTPIERVSTESPAAAAGLKTGDIILKIDETMLRRASQLADALAERRPGDVLKLTVLRGGKEVEAQVKLAAERAGASAGGRPPGGGFGGRGGGSGPAPTTPWTKPRYRLAVVGVEFNDIQHNAKIPLQEWDLALFSTGVYSKKNSTGQDVSGSLNDFCREQSYGFFRLEGKVFDWVKVAKKRGDYSQGSGTSNRGALPTEAIEKLLARDGKECLKDYDGVFVVYAGANTGTNRGAVYYPHAGTLTVQGKRVPYLLSFEGGERMAAVRSFAREFCYLLGLPDLAARTENIGSEGVGVWCLLGGALDNRPQGLCAWAKEQLGWLKPAVIDPTVKQKLILKPISSAATQCVKVLVRADGSEYFLLENRTKFGADQGLPGEGLVIWRVVSQRPILEESHGIEGAAGPRSLTELIPYPSKANNALTPLTVPSSRSARGGGLPVHITEIRRLADGRITFHVGYDYQ